VDMIEDADGVVRVLEVDAWAGFAGITEVTGADVAGAILGHAAARHAAARNDGAPGPASPGAPGTARGPGAGSAVG